MVEQLKKNVTNFLQWGYASDSSIGKEANIGNVDVPIVRPEKFQFLEKGQNRNFDYKIIISVKNP